MVQNSAVYGHHSLYIFPMDALCILLIEEWVAVRSCNLKKTLQVANNFAPVYIQTM